jgi:hypothetical protein
MPSFRTPPFFRLPRSYRPLRSFHLTPVDTSAHLDYVASQKTNLTSPTVKASEFAPHNVAIPLHGSTIAMVAVVISLVFISTLSFAFIGARSTVDDPYFRLLLDETARISPGVPKRQDPNLSCTNLFLVTDRSFRRKC